MRAIGEDAGRVEQGDADQTADPGNLADESEVEAEVFRLIKQRVRARSPGHGDAGVGEKDIPVEAVAEAFGRIGADRSTETLLLADIGRRRRVVALADL